MHLGRRKHVPPRASQARNHTAPSFLRQWRFQILAATLATTSYVTLISVVACYADRPLSEWIFHDTFSINGLVALLSTMMKSALLVPITSAIGQEKWAWFSSPTINSQKLSKPGKPLRDLQCLDDASRGPWGSFIWLTRTISQPNFVQIGALLTILAIGIDTFSQNIINIRSRSVGSTIRGGVPFAQNVSATPRSTLLAAIYQGIFSDNIPDLQVSCPTGNCSWEAVPSVGVCGKCFDITDKMPPEWASCSGYVCNYTTSATWFGEDSIEDYETWAPERVNWMLGPKTNGNNSLGDALDQLQPLTLLDKVQSNTTNRLHFSLINPMSSRSYNTFPDLQLYPGFEVINIPLRDEVSSRFNEMYVNAPSGEASIVQCRLWYCLQELSISVRSGRQNESIRTQDPKYIFDRFVDEGSLTWYYFNSTAFQLRQNFSVEHWELMWLEISQQIQGTGYIGQDFKIFNNGDTGASQYILVDPSVFAWDRMRIDPDKWIGNIAKSMTNVIRQQNQVTGDANVYNGTVYTQQLYISASYPWMIYPSLILVSGLAFFGFTVFRTSSSGRYMWENGLVPLLLIDVGDDVKLRAQDSMISNEALLKTIGGEVVTMARA
ncbi:hypothetical protein F5X97DRAFT_338685 [Nemania serpens]|nr:hypothetical protein F5X97DRAFT_338685 [Nemania serpens]